MARHNRVSSQTKDLRTGPLRCVFVKQTLLLFLFFYFSFLPWHFMQIHTPVPVHGFTLSLTAYHSCPSVPVQMFSLSSFHVPQAPRPSRSSEMSPGTKLWGWGPQLCWGVRCCGPLGPCSGSKMVSSWDLRRACQAFHATVWLETPREVNGDVHRICSLWHFEFFNVDVRAKLMCRL